MEHVLFNNSRRTLAAPLIHSTDSEMAPKLLFDLRPNSGARFDNKAFEELPKLAAYPMRVIGIWSSIEHTISIILAQILKVEAGTGLLIYNALSGEGAKRQMMEAVTKEKLSNDLHALWKAVLNENEESRSHRNDFSHRLWGLCYQIPGILVAARSKDFGPHIPQALSHHRTTGLSKKSILPYPGAALASAQAWDETSLQDAVSLALKANERMDAFHELLIDPKDAACRSRLLELLPLRMPTP